MSLWLLLSVIVASADELRVVTHHMAPYSVLQEQQLYGVAVDLVRCTLQSLNQPYVISVRPVSRAQQQLELGLADMFFIASETPERDAVAEFSKPITYAKRMLYGTDARLSEMSEKQLKQLLVGVLHGSAMHRWLLEQQFAHIQARYDYHILFQLLERGRIDAVLAPEAIYQQELTDLHLSQQRKIYHRLMKNISLGAYVSHSWLLEHPGFMAAFNQHLSACQSGQKQD